MARTYGGHRIHRMHRDASVDVRPTHRHFEPGYVFPYSYSRVSPLLRAALHGRSTQLVFWPYLLFCALRCIVVAPCSDNLRLFWYNACSRQKS